MRVLLYNIKELIMKYIYILVAVVGLISCKSEDNSNKNKIGQQANSERDERLVLGDIGLNIPSGWHSEVPENKMRVAQLSYVKSPSYKLAVFYFGEQDMVDANIERWKNQFTKLESEESIALDVEGIVTLKLQGTYKKKPYPMSQDFVEAPDYAMLAAIVPTSEGPYYLKISAHKEFILEIEQDFLGLLNSYEKLKKN